MEELKKQLRALEPAQLMQIQVYVAGLLGAPFKTAAELEESETKPLSATDDPDSAWMDLLFVDVCKGLGIGNYMTQRARAALDRHRPNLIRYLKDSCPGADQRIIRAVLDTGFRMLYRMLINTGLTIGPAQLASHLDRLPAVFDRAFPGYAQSGLLAQIIRVEKEDASS
jgi:hypothetical protein